MSKLQVKIDGEYKDLAEVEEVKINGETFRNYAFDWERSYVKEPEREKILEHELCFVRKESENGN